MKSWIETYGHGGDLFTAAETFGRHGTEFLDFSANINPLGPPKRVIAALKNNLHTIVHYPDPAHRMLKKKLSNVLTIGEDSLAIGNGAAESMANVLLALTPRSVGLIYPCFSEYEILAKTYGIQIHACYSKEENKYQADETELKTLFQNSDLVFIGYPNNPTGVLYDANYLKQMAAWSTEYGTYMVVDEAFLDFVAREKRFSLLPSLSDFPNVILVRSMTKFYAIPGLRLGFTVAHPDIIDKMIKKQVTWSVNQLALMAGEACLLESSYGEKTIALIAQERLFLQEQLTALGLQVYESEVNFLLVKSKTKTASEWQYQLGTKGILIRSCANYQGLTDDHFRVAVRTRTENEQLIIAMREGEAG